MINKAHWDISTIVPSKVLASEIAEPSPFPTISSLLIAATATAEAAASASASQSCTFTHGSFARLSFSKKSVQSLSSGEILREICTSARLDPGAPIPCETTRLLV